jgi:hypothetical protein
LQLSFFLLAGSLAFAADPPRSTDDQLRDSLNSKTDDDYDRALLGDQAKPDDKGRVDEALQKKLRKELGAAAQKEGQVDPLLKVAEDMRDAQQRLARPDSGAETQFLQGQIVSELAKLIEEAKKSKARSGGANSNGPRQTTNDQGKAAQAQGRPPASSSPRAQESDPKHVKADNRAEAAATARSQMLERFRAALQGRTGAPMLEDPSEYFLPEYKLEIEDYYRRLSGDQSKPRRQ